MKLAPSVFDITQGIGSSATIKFSAGYLINSQHSTDLTEYFSYEDLRIYSYTIRR